MKISEIELENYTSISSSVRSTNTIEEFSKIKSFIKKYKKKSWEIFYGTLKRVFDILCAIIGCICLVPIIICVKIAYLICKDTAPVIFKQERIGKHGEKIYIYKIRSMVHNAEQILEELLEKDPEIRREYLTNKKIENDPRITKIGKFIRKTSIDEFGQFINVLKGEMTVVGPRPYLPREKDDMTRYYKDIITCKPGITGLWQVNGRCDIDFTNRCRLDSFYSKHKCLIFDMKIFAKTFEAVLNKQGAK